MAALMYAEKEQEELSTYSPDLRNDLLLAEVRLQNQTDGEISAF